jgi:hypothetical protein
MNNEIKEILDYYRNIVNDKKETYTVVSRDTIYLEKLLDYITNLQHTEDLYNQLLKDYDNEVEENIKLTKLWKNEVEKRRKAIEYINNGSYFDGSSMCKNDLLNILNGKE